eukprot:3726041-Lingulodinium_polyedra.AAC.1
MPLLEQALDRSTVILAELAKRLVASAPEVGADPALLAVLQAADTQTAANMAVATSEPTPVPTPAVSQQLPCQQLSRPPEWGGRRG